MSSEGRGQLTLYSYWRSSAAYRVRIALYLKKLRFKTIPVHLVKQGGEQHNETFRSVNPQGLVPVLEHEGHVLTQSMAICEYLDECFEPYPLLPSDPTGRARVRSLALQVACEIHPLNNLRVLKFLKGQYGEAVDSVEWMAHWMNEGFVATELGLKGIPWVAEDAATARDVMLCEFTGARLHVAHVSTKGSVEITNWKP